MLDREKTVEITKELAPYAPEEQIGEYKLRRWSWFEKQGATERSTQIIDAGKGIVHTSITDYYSEALCVIVREAPKDLTWDINFIKNELDANVGDILRDAMRTIIELPSKNRFLEQSEPELDTLG